MKLVIYGVSRSGKDYLIDNTCSYLKKKGIPLKHIKGSQELNEISEQLYGSSFKNLDDDTKRIVRKKFVSMLQSLEKQYKNIIVDGHYAFYGDDGVLFDVITDEDLQCYDVFIYLNTPSITIMNRINSYGIKTSFKEYTVNHIESWKNYEIENLTNNLLAIDKELHVIQNDAVITYQYIEDIIKGMHNSKLIAERIVESIINKSSSSVYLVTDCDKTLSFEDSTDLVFKKNNLENKMLKNIYEGDYYTNYQSYLASHYYMEKSLFDDSTIEFTIKKLSINKELIKDLRKLNVPIIALSGGNERIWNGFFKKYDFKIDFYNNQMIMSKYIKYFVVKYLISNNKLVLSVGDSLMDSLMLKSSTKGYLINLKGYRHNLEMFLQNNPNVYQLSYNYYIFDTNSVDDNITLVKTLDSSNDKIKTLIDLSKSTSGVDGVKLRKAHKEVGRELAHLIDEMETSTDFAVVIMMRSGLMIGEGIADKFDCPVLFYDDCYDSKFIEEWNYLNQKKEYTAIICDGVINSGRSIENFIKKTCIKRFIIATNVVSSKCKKLNIWPIYTARISNNSFVVAKQKIISDGKGPDTSERLFKTL